MIIRTLISNAVTMLCLMFFLQTAWAGYELERRSGQQDMFDKNQVSWESKSKEYYDYPAGRMAQENVILRFDKGEIIILVREKQAYYRNSIEGFCADMDALLKKMMSSPMFQQAKQAMAQMGKQDGGDSQQANKAPIKLQKIGAEKVAGYTADHYQTRIGDEVIEEHWVANDSRIKGLSPNINPSLEKMGKQFESCQRRFDKTMSEMMGEDFSTSAKDLVQEVPDVEGFALKNRNGLMVSEVTSIKKADIPVSRFEPPKGYQPMKLTDLYQVE